MPEIAEIEDTSNPYAVKFILKEPLTWGVTHSYDNAGQAKDDALAAALFNIEHVTNVFYVDKWITVTQDGGANWRKLVRKLATSIRAAPMADVQTLAIVAQATNAMTGLNQENQQRLVTINLLFVEPPCSARQQHRESGSVD